MPVFRYRREINLRATGTIGFILTPDTEFFKQKINHATLSLQDFLIVNSKRFFHHGAASLIWARAWPLMHFIDTYRDHLPAVPFLEDWHLPYGVFVAVLGLLIQDPTAFQQIDGQPGIRTIVLRMSGHGHLEEAIASVGGRPSALALPLGNKECAVDAFQLVHAPALEDALLQHGYVSSLTLACHISAPEFDDEIDLFCSPTPIAAYICVLTPRLGTIIYYTRGKDRGT
ncbi:hypothetical protein FB451DRAFT_1184764 [Mycena latifolia]|nr:hypothetical protein FB451DRAFT_1184764 [Mycena latifolia]